MLELDELKKLHDKAYQSGQITREHASDDLVFANVTQWDDQLLTDAELSYRGEFNIIRKARRQIMAELNSNPVQVDFEPKDEGRDDAAEFLDGLYRSDDRLNTSLEAYQYASQESVDCGYGAWELYTKYETSRAGDENQVIRRRWIPESCNTAYCDPNAKRQDKSDAMYWSILRAYSEDGYRELAADLTDEEIEDITPWVANFKYPEQSYTFPWVAEGKKIWITNFYHKEKVKDKVITFIDMFGQEVKYRESEVFDFMDDLENGGYEIVSTQEIERWQVTKYIASGREILSAQVIPGEYIPVVPVYGERAIVEGEEYYSGITRLAKDPQRLRNFQMSYLADILSRSPRRKPIFYPEQIQGLEYMYDQAGSENNYPYLLQNRLTANGEQLPIGPVAEMPEQPIPQALIAGLQETRAAVADVADPGLPQDIADPDMSGKAIYALQARVDKQSYIYQHNLKFAKRYDGLVYASMAAEVYDAPRTVTLTAPDGTRKKVKVMEAVIADDGELKVLNDLTNMEFEVHSDIGPSYDSQKEQTLERMQMLAQTLDPTDPMRQFAILKLIELSPGAAMDDMRDYARKQLILSGLKEPETEEEQMMVMQAQQAQANQPNPAMMEGQARIMEGQAAIMNEENDRIKLTIDKQKADNDTAKVQIAAAEAGVKIENTQADTMKKMTEITSNRLENMSRLYQ